ncbi:MAG: hypothetical protein LBT54_06595 [Bifidobacteriaceae bacterium]|nr:hypothetical protein [Bifidobacteriaceae bacterium]
MAPAGAAAGAIRITLTGAAQYDYAELYCFNAAGSEYSQWQGVDSALANAAGVFAFDSTQPGQRCTVYYSGYTRPAQTIGGHFSGPDGSGLFTTFITDAAGGFTGQYPLAVPAVVSGTVPVPVPPGGSVTLYLVHTDAVTKLRTFTPTNSTTPNSATGAFTFSADPGRVYTVSYSANGYAPVWYGNVPIIDNGDAFNPLIKTFTTPAAGASVNAGRFDLKAVGATIRGTLTGASASPSVWVINQVSGLYRAARFDPATKAYAASGLTPGVYVVQVSSGVARGASGLVAVGANRSSVLNLTVAAQASRSLGRVHTSISGALKAGAKITAAATAVAPSTGLKVSFSYTWITATAIIGTGAKLTVPGLKGQAVYVVTRAGFAGGDPAYSVTKAPGKITAKNAPKFTVKVKGTAKVGKRLTAAVAKVPKGFAKKYQWLSNGKAIKGKAAKKAAYKLAKADKGKKISVKVTVKRKGYANGVKTSKKTKKVAAK